MLRFSITLPSDPAEAKSVHYYTLQDECISTYLEYGKDLITHKVFQEKNGNFLQFYSI